MTDGLSSLTRDEDQDPAMSVESDDDDEREDMDISPPVPKTKTFREAIQSLECETLSGFFDQASSIISC